ncbi:hypothetical protein C1646_719495 [Rhizophagus diaphanus]|nr:hypothetical protein C1646_719495 [Rhizophagus diaphanus] [Rhizophagus sp. MUCL 43196]
MVDLDLEISVLESYLKLYQINYSGCYEDFRRIKVYGIQIYDYDFYIYSMCLPFTGVYYFKLKKKFSCSTITFLLFKELPKFISNLWIMQVSV